MITIYTNSLASFESVDDLLAYHPRWQTLTQEQKEECIKRCSRIINRLEFIGSKTSESQPLEFPRTLEHETDEAFSVSAIKKRLESAVAIFVEYDLDKVGTSQISYSHGNETLSARIESIPRAVIQILAPIMR
jgi:hypothetical protein